ncbi:MAG: SRPBCC domain-containing protein [Chitinophagaceae bacterium]
MLNQQLIIHTKLRIEKPAQEVYETIVDPQKMAHYFISQGSGRMESGKDVIWKFPEFDMDVPICVENTVADKYISFYWDERDNKHLVEITLEADGSAATIVSVSEGEEEVDGEGIEWLQRNTEGWANFLACLKAYLEYGINLRKGAFDFLKK